MASRIDTLKSLIATTAADGALEESVEKLMLEAAVNTLLHSNTSADALRYLEKTLAVKALTNLTDCERRCRLMLDQHRDAVVFCLSEMRRMSQLPGLDSDLWTVLINFLSNVTRWEFWVEEIAKMKNEEFNLDLILDLSSSRLQQLLPFLLNLSQSSSVRHRLCQPPHRLRNLLPFLHRQHKTETRILAAGVAKNVCFEDDCHPMLVTAESCDALSALLCCLVDNADIVDGGIDDEDFNDLPIGVQEALREEGRRREDQEEVRLRLIRALLQLCATPVGRDALVNTNTYVVLRELYKWESDHGSRAVLLDVQHVIDVLITETEPNPEQVVPDYDRSVNFRHVAVTEEDAKLVERVDGEFLQR